MAIQVLYDKYDMAKYSDEELRHSSNTYDKLPIGFDVHSSFDEYSKIKPLRYMHMAHVKVDRTLGNGDKRRCNIGLMDKYQYY